MPSISSMKRIEGAAASASAKEADMRFRTSPKYPTLSQVATDVAIKGTQANCASYISPFADRIREFAETRYLVVALGLSPHGRLPG